MTAVQQAQDYIRSLPIKPRISFSLLYPRANPLAIDLLTQMLQFDPIRRISCEQAVTHPYFTVWHDPADEPSCPSVSCWISNSIRPETQSSLQTFDFSFEEEDSIEGMKKLIVEEVRSFRREVRNQARASTQFRRQDRWKFFNLHLKLHWQKIESLPLPSREEIINSPVQEHGPLHGATSGFTTNNFSQRLPSPVYDDPSAELDRELANAHMGRRWTMIFFYPLSMGALGILLWIFWMIGSGHRSPRYVEMWLSVQYMFAPHTISCFCFLISWVCWICFVLCSNPMDCRLDSTFRTRVRFFLKVCWEVIQPYILLSIVKRRLGATGPFEIDFFLLSFHYFDIHWNFQHSRALQSRDVHLRRVINLISCIPTTKCMYTSK